MDKVLGLQAVIISPGSLGREGIHSITEANCHNISTDPPGPSYSGGS